MKSYLTALFNQLKLQTWGPPLVWRPLWRRGGETSPSPSPNPRSANRQSPNTYLAWAVYRALPGPRVDYHEQSPSYTALQISLPPAQWYPTAAAFFADLFHETGHYVLEEIDAEVRANEEEVAVELASMALCSLTGLGYGPNNVAYLQRYLNKCRNREKSWRKAERAAKQIVMYVMRR